MVAIERAQRAKIDAIMGAATRGVWHDDFVGGAEVAMAAAAGTTDRTAWGAGRYSLFDIV